jgi:hypothetical protein
MIADLSKAYDSTAVACLGACKLSYAKTLHSAKVGLDFYFVAAAAIGSRCSQIAIPLFQRRTGHQIFCIVTLTLVTRPVVRLYETQKPRLS